MISVSDIIKLLEQIPLWKSLATMPRRLTELEARVKALEGLRTAQAAPAANDCPACRIPLRFEREEDDPVFRDLGVKLHHLRCDGCGKTMSRRYDPAKGYG